MSRKPFHQAGFALPAAIFLLLVIGMLVVLMSRFSVNQAGTINLGVQQARAWQAARSALAWGIHQVNATAACASGAVSLAGSNLAGFSASLSCTQRSYTDERGNTVRLFELVATASNGSPGSRADYAWRQISGVVER